jgi:hypothetical protein
MGDGTKVVSHKARLQWRITIARTYSQNLIFVPVKHMGHETSVSAERLPCHCISESLFLLCHVPDVVSLRIHDNVFVRLFKATKKDMSGQLYKFA